jgi:hypothetical protein
MAKKILVYDLKGKNFEPIPLCFDAPKGKFSVDTQAGTAIVSLLPFTGAQAVVWKQTLNGKLIASVAPGHLAVQRDFSNETSKSLYGENYDFQVFTFVPRADSLYRYDSKNNKIVPLFTLNFNNKPLTIHTYHELPNYFMGELSEPKQISATTTVTQNKRFYIIDKQTLKGTFFSFENDYLGGLKIEWPVYQFSGDYFVQNYDPGDLLDALTNLLETNKNLSKENKAKITKLKDSINANDNNYILYAKLKK